MARKLAAPLVPAARQARIIVGDPYPVIVHGVRKMIEDDPRFQVVADACTMSSFQKKIIAERPEVALLDWCMASKDIDLTTALLRSHSRSTSILFLTVTEDSQQKREMLKLGARAFLTKWCSARSLRMAVGKACHSPALGQPAALEPHAGDSHAVPFLAEPEKRVNQLTRRERQLLTLVCNGLKNKEIALRLGIAESTVWHHLTSIFTKLRVEDRVGLVAFAYNHHLVAPAPSRRPVENVDAFGSPQVSARYQPTGHMALSG